MDFDVAGSGINGEEKANLTNTESVEAFPVTFHLFDVQFREGNDPLCFHG